MGDFLLTTFHMSSYVGPFTGQNSAKIEIKARDYRAISGCLPRYYRALFSPPDWKKASEKPCFEIRCKDNTFFSNIQIF